MQITAFALTVTVASSHIPKLISYLMECGTDFQNVFDSGTRKSEGLHYTRFFYASFFLICAFAMIWDRIEFSNQSVDIISLEFGIYSANLWPIIALIYSTQLVFSWPQEDSGAQLMGSPTASSNAPVQQNQL
ncbi:MAG: hypothetical protein AAF739_01355 [Pseudomonadota bacterium]